jgi:membrane fusion protein (multidrug efflux system)
MSEARSDNVSSTLALTSAPAPVARDVELKPRSYKKLVRILIALVVLGAGGFFGTRFVTEMMTFETTDDAFITAHVHTVTAKVSGTVTDVLVEDHQLVKKGDLLVKLDPRDYEAQLHISQSRLTKSSRDLARMKHGHVVAPADGDDDDAFGDDDDVEDVATANTYAPDEKKIMDEYSANSTEAQNEVKRSLLNIEFTQVTAPESGRIGKRSVETGQVVAAGQALMALVEPNAWINANFKETQLGRIRIGQAVTISVDAIPDHKFTGHVESIAAASGSTYSLLPPDNATGNFTKVVQRVPVKISFDPESVKGFEPRIAAGMSTEVSVRVRN